MEAFLKMATGKALDEMEQEIAQAEKEGRIYFMDGIRDADHVMPNLLYYMTDEQKEKIRKMVVRHGL